MPTVKDLARMDDADRRLDFFDAFVISAGTVTLDLDQRLVLLLHSQPSDKHLLPKGRANAGEPLPTAAVRETLEESGYACRLFAHDAPTRATGLRPGELHTEPLAIQQRTYPDGVRKIVFWYLAEGHASATPAPRPLEDEVMFEARWVPFVEAGALASWDDDRQIIERALNLVEVLRCEEDARGQE